MLKRITAAVLLLAMLLGIPAAASSDEVPAIASITEDDDEELGEIITGVTAGTPFKLTAPSVLLMEKSTGTIIIEKNADERRAPASITKVMTLILIMRALETGVIKLEDMVTVSEYAAGMGGSQAYLEAGEKFSVHDMLKCVIVSSCNDAAVALAEHISGSAEVFVAEMNRVAAELGMKNTNFINCTGLDAQGHYTTARDIAVMSRELLKHEKIREYTLIWMDSIRGGEFSLTNTNKLIKSYSGITGLKTGSTDEALFCVSATAMRDGMELIAVVLGAPTGKERFIDAAKLLDYGFAAYSVAQYELPETGQVSVRGGKKEAVATRAEETKISRLIKKGSAAVITSEVELPAELIAPVEPGQSVGRVKYLLNGEIIFECDIKAVEAVLPKSFFDCFFDVMRLYFMIGKGKQ